MRVQQLVRLAGDRAARPRQRDPNPSHDTLDDLSNKEKEVEVRNI